MSLNISNGVINLTAATLSLQYYGCLTLVNIGLVANVLNIIVSMRKELQKNTMGFYNILISVFNILSLIFVGYINFFPQTIGQESYLTRSDYNCKLILYLSKIFPPMASWLNVMVSLDRLLCVYNISRFKFINDKRKLLLIALGLFVTIAAISVSNLLFSVQIEAAFDSTINQITQNRVCTANERVKLVRDTLGTITRIILPVILPFVINALLIYKLVTFRHMAGISRSLRNEYQFVFTIIIFNCVCFIMEMPVLISVIFVNKYGYNETLISRTSNASAIASFAYVCSYITGSFLFVCLFFVNVATNRIFRKECIKIFFHYFSFFELINVISF